MSLELFLGLCSLLFLVCSCLCVFFFKQKTAYEMRISDWSSDVCSSDLTVPAIPVAVSGNAPFAAAEISTLSRVASACAAAALASDAASIARAAPGPRSEEHTSELQSLMRISYAVFCLKKKKHTTNKQHSK